MILFAQKLATAIKTLQSCGYLHRDIRPANIIIKETAGKFEPYLADLGSVGHKSKNTGPVCTILRYAGNDLLRNIIRNGEV